LALAALALVVFGAYDSYPSKSQFLDDNFYFVTITKANSNGEKKIVKLKKIIISTYTVVVCTGT